MNLEKKKKLISDESILSYINAINTAIFPIKKITDVISYINKKSLDPTNNISNGLRELTKEEMQHMKPIIDVATKIQNISKNISEDKEKTYTKIISQIMRVNNGYISSKMLEPLNISRNYLSILEKKNLIEKVSRGIYMSREIIEDEYFIFQTKYKKVIFSHMNALYFHGLTQEIPYTYTVTIPNSYHVEKINKKHKVFYADNYTYELGVTEVLTNMKNRIKVYDIERCICDIIRSKNKMDLDQVKYSVKAYLKLKDKDLIKLSQYSQIMGIKESVMEFIEMMYD